MRTFDPLVMLLAGSAALISGLLGVPWVHAAVAAVAIVAFRALLVRVPAFRPAVVPPAPPVPFAPPAHQVRQIGGPGGVLSPRELEVALLLPLGLTNKAIGQRLFIEESTVDTHVRHAMEKFDVHSRTEVVTKLAEHGLIPDRTRRP